MLRHIISILIENESGALSRVAGLFSARGYNIESLTVAPTEDPSLSRMTILTSGSDEVLEQITKQLNKLVDVVKVVDLSEAAHVERELMLIKVRATGKDREEMKRMADIFRGRIIDVTESTYVIELTGASSKLDSFIAALDAGLILETVRTGVCGIGRGDRILNESLLRQGRRSLPHQGQEGHHRWLWLPGPRPRPEPERFWLQGHCWSAQGRRFLEKGRSCGVEGRRNCQGSQGCRCRHDSVAGREHSAGLQRRSSP
jgi:acetolactate synthase-1/3 small subunit